MKSNRKYYLNNQKYTNFLASQDKKDFQKYVDYILRYAKKGQSVLDVGCGAGIALKILVSKKIDAFGVEISKTSVKTCLKNKLQCSLYDGEKLPFKNEMFDVVGSYNVLEHTVAPEKFLNEQLRVLKKGGYLIISCPNFLSITNSYHHHTTGILQKMQNLGDTIRKIFLNKPAFHFMQTIHRKDFQPDDDACVVTNPLDILHWGKQNKLKVIFWSSQPFYKPGITKYLDYALGKLFLGGCFIILKNER